MTHAETARARQPRRRQSALICGALGLVGACLNPAISDELPISESALVVDTADAGEPVVEEPSESEPGPSTPPRPGRDGDERTRDRDERTIGARRR